MPELTTSCAFFEGSSQTYKHYPACNSPCYNTYCLKLSQSTGQVLTAMQMIAVLCAMTAQIAIAANGSPQTIQTFTSLVKNFEIVRISLWPLLLFGVGISTLKSAKQIQKTDSIYYALKTSVNLSDLVLFSLFSVTSTISSVASGSFPAIDLIAKQLPYFGLMRHGLKIAEYTAGVAVEKEGVLYPAPRSDDPYPIALCDVMLAVLNILIITNKMFNLASSNVWTDLISRFALSSVGIYLFTARKPQNL